MKEVTTMSLKRIKIYTNIEKTNVEQDEKMEVEQKLTITSTGNVSFSSSLYGGGYNHYRKGRKAEVKIEPEVAKEIMDQVEEYFTTQNDYNITPGFGLWSLTVTDDKRNMHEYFGSTTGVHNTLTTFIQRRIPIDGLIVFGG